MCGFTTKLGGNIYADTNEVFKSEYVDVVA